MEVPLLALWGEQGTVGAMYDVLATWREKAVEVTGHAVAARHVPQEECPGQVLEALGAFLLDA